MMSVNEYLLLSDYKFKKAGSIIFMKETEIKTSKNNQIIKLSYEERQFYKKYNENIRVERYHANSFNKAKLLQKNYECYLKIKKENIKIKILDSEFRKNDLILTCRTIDGSIKAIPMSMIEDVFSETEIQKESQKTSGFLSPATPGNNTLGREGIPKTIFCAPIHGNVINPIQIKRIQLNNEQKFDKYIVINIKSKSSVVKLLWKGLVDDQICLGCDLLVDWSDGTDGEFNDHPLFSCDKKSAVLIPVDENLNTCESTPRQHKVLSSDTVIIREEDICCVETARDQNIYLNKTIIADQNCKTKGICKWTGLVNDRECVMIVSDAWMPAGNYWRDRIVDTLKLCPGNCSNLSIIETKNIPKTIFCEPINEQVIYPIHIKGEEISDKQKLDKYLIMNKKDKPFILKSLWKGLVNRQICLGCDLLTDWSEGTDGEFNGVKLFSCDRNRGVLIPQSSMMNSCIFAKHRDIQISTDKCEVVKEDCICCVEAMDKFTSVNIAIGNKLQYGQNNMLKGSCTWLGMINGVQCVGILDQDCTTRHYRYDGSIRKVGICGIQYSICAIVTLDALKSYKFVNDLFLENTSKIDEKIISRETNIYKIGQLIQAGEDPVFCGLVEFFLKYSTDDLVGLKVNEDQISKYVFGSKIKFEAPLFTRNDFGIIVKTKGTEALKEEVELMNNSKLIKPDSIKYKERCDLQQFKIGDIVKHNPGELYNCFRVDNVWMLNKVPCVEVSKATKMNKSHFVKYVRAQDIVKFETSDIQTRYFQDTIIDCESVKVWEKVDLPNISVGDKVEFVIRKTEERCKGIVQHSGKANKIASCIVQLLTNLGNANAYRINETKRFMKYCKNIEDPMVIVPADVLQKYNGTVTTSGIPIIDPGAVKTANGKQTSEKYIAFKSNNKRHFLFLKWRGFVNGIYCFGGAIDGEDQLGTNGTFAGKPLFKCKEKCGVLILPDKLTDCCLNKNHNDWMIKEEKIDEPSICCIKTKAKLNENNKISIDGRLQKKNSKVTGVCIWMGLVNNKEALFIEFGDQIPVGSGGGKEIFHFRLSRGAFFGASGFAHELEHVPGMAIGIINPFNIRAIENGKEIKKIICTKVKQKKETLNLKWRGLVNGELCVGCQLTRDVEYGTDGCYLGSRLFTCPGKTGVLIPVDQIGDSCEYTGIHTEIEKNQVYFSYLRGVHKTLKFDSVCCIEWLENIQKLPRLCLESSVKYKDLIGTCKWIGLMNGKEVVGVEMDKEFREGTNGTFDTFDLFTCDPGKGCLFMAEDIIHDVEAEKLYFVEDEVIDIERILSVKTMNNFTKFLFKMGDPVITFINTTVRFGELKWTGLINNQNCVGLDLEDAFEHGMNGMTCGQMIFLCPEGHGLITPLAKIQYYNCANKLHQYENGLINPNKYIKCEEKYDRRFLDERKINKNDLVLVTVCYENEQIRLKGTLRWCGVMNDISVGAVELDQDNIRGTDGTFWRQRLFQCRQKRAIAVPWDRITQYIPYETRPIPEEKKIFPDININSAVKYFHTFADDIKDLYGTVRWTGVDETGEYLFGIELDDRIPGGTDGEFLGQRLFHCTVDYGFLAPLNTVMKDTRFVDEEPESEEPNHDTDNPDDIEPRRESNVNINKYKLMQKYFMRLLSEITDEQLRSDILTDLISSDQINMIESFIGCHQNRTNFEIYPNLLPYLVKKERFDMTKVILELVIVTEKSDAELLYIANEVLKKNQDEIFHLALDKCNDKNVLLKNGETFLTNLFKEGYSEIDINNIIDKGIFKVDIPNVKGESPLLLACKHVMVSIVAKLLLNRPISVSQRAEAIKVAIGVLSDSSVTNVPLDNIRKIVTLLNESEILASAECPICMNGIVNVSFQCGHCSCNTCYENLITCPICNIDILKVHRFYL